MGSVEQQAIIVRLLFDPIVPDVVDALCFQVLKKCCQLSENCNQPCQPMFLCTPNEWYVHVTLRNAAFTLVVVVLPWLLQV